MKQTLEITCTKAISLYLPPTLNVHQTFQAHWQRLYIQAQGQLWLAYFCELWPGYDPWESRKTPLGCPLYLLKMFSILPQSNYCLKCKRNTIVYSVKITEELVEFLLVSLMYLRLTLHILNRVRVVNIAWVINNVVEIEQTKTLWKIVSLYKVEKLLSE